MTRPAGEPRSHVPVGGAGPVYPFALPRLEHLAWREHPHPDGCLLGGLSYLPGVAGLTAWSCLAPALAPDDSAVAFVSDHDGSPRV